MYLLLSCAVCNKETRGNSLQEAAIDTSQSQAGL